MLWVSVCWDIHLQTLLYIVAQPQCCSRDTDSSEEIPWKIYRKYENRHPEPNGLEMVRRNCSFWGLHVTCLTTISSGREFMVSWEWAGRLMDAQALIGSSRLPIFRLVSCPSLVCVQLCIGMKGKMSACSLSLSTSHHGNSPRARSLALKRTLLCHLLAVSPLGRFTCWKFRRPWTFWSFPGSWLVLYRWKSFIDNTSSVCFSLWVK